MNHTLLRSTILGLFLGKIFGDFSAIFRFNFSGLTGRNCWVTQFMSAGLCHGAGVIPEESLRGTSGGSVTFTTSVKPSAEPFLALTWSVNGTTNVITSTSVDVVGKGYENRVTLDKSTGTLVLSNLTAKDSGEYELIIIPLGAQQLQGTVKLEVLSKYVLLIWHHNVW